MFLSRVQVFPPSFQELPPPALDLFDLDEHFSSERVRVAQITNKCQSHNLLTNASRTKLHAHPHTHARTHAHTRTHTHTRTHARTHAHTHAHTPGSDEDLEYYVRECGEILGVTNKLPPDSRTAKDILSHIFTQIVEFKKFNQVIVCVFTGPCAAIPLLVAWKRWGGSG